jgi:hypothetical protein
LEVMAASKPRSPIIADRRDEGRVGGGRDGCRSRESLLPRLSP